METILSVIAIVISICSGCFAIYTFIWSANRDRKQATLDAYHVLQNEAFDKLNLFAPAEIREIANNNRSLKYKEVAGYIARIEHFCVGVNTRIYDKKTVYELAHGYLDGPVILQRINPVIDKKNNHSDEDFIKTSIK